MATDSKLPNRARASNNTMPKKLAQSQVLYLKLNLGPFSTFVETICHWTENYLPQNGAASQDAVGRYVCVAPVSVCMESFWDDNFRRICREADLVTPDGTPIVWALRKLGYTSQQRVSGPDLLPALCREAAFRGIPIGLYGSTSLGLESLQANLLRLFPGLQIAYSYAPPFRPAGAVTPAEELEAIRQSGARILFVGIGCPKQEIWMAQNKAALPLVMLGVGAAFAFHAGELRRAPRWMQKAGLEWLFRLLQEPRRLFQRYLKTNLAYLWHTRCLSKRQLRKYL